MAIGEMQLTAVGNLTKDPEMRYTPSGVAVAAFAVAVNARQYDKETGKWVDGGTSFVDVQCWRDLAEHVAESLVRGDRVVITGRYKQDHWEKDGEKRSRWTLTADEVGAALSFATVKVAKSARSQDTPPDDAWASASKTRPAQVAGDPGGFEPDPPF